MKEVFSVTLNYTDILGRIPWKTSCWFLYSC